MGIPSLFGKAFLLFSIILLAACSGSSNSTQTVATVGVSPATATIDVGGVQQLVAVARDADGIIVHSASITFSSNNSAVATVSSAGLVTGIAVGSATITATAGDASGTMTVTVNTPVASLTLTPATATLAEGDTQQLTATAKDSGGNTLTSVTISFSSNNTAVATASDSGLVTAVSAGNATISATAGGITKTAAITVTPPPIAITGSLYSPTGSLASLQNRSLFDKLLGSLVASAYGQTDGLTPVSGANVLVFRINDDGTPNGGVIGSAVTNSDGTFSVDVPADTQFASNLIIQATAGTTPQQVGPAGLNTQNCPVAQQDLPPITPAVEFATRTLIAQIATNGSSLADYTVDEVKAIVTQAISLAADSSLVGTTIDDTISNIAAVAEPQIKELIEDTKSAGEATAPTGLGGTYNLIGLQANVDTFSEQRAQEIGTATIDVANKTFTVDTTMSEIRLDEACAADPNDSCARTFTFASSSNANTIAGSITVLSGNQIAFQPTGNDGGAIGGYNAAGDIIIIPTEDELIIAVKQSSTAAAFDGTYNGKELDSSLMSTFSVSASNPSWNIGSTSANDISLSISGGSFSGTSNQNSMQKQITCGSSCPDTEYLNASTSSNPIAGSISVSATGTLTVTPTGQSALTGVVTGDGNMFALATGDTTGGDTGMVVGVKQGSGMNQASTSGTYRAATIELELDTSTSRVRTEGGTITLDGNGNGYGSLVGVETYVYSTCTTNTCGNYTRGQSGTTDSPQFTYSVGSTGAVTVTADPSTSIQGYASQDGSVIVLTAASNGTIGQQASTRGLYVLIK